MRVLPLLVSLVLCVASTACVEPDEGQRGPRSWGGFDPHLYFAGQLDEEQLFFEAEANEVADTTQCWATREYRLDDEQRPRLEVLRVTSYVELAGEERVLELSLRHPDFAALLELTDLNVVAGAEGLAPEIGETTVDWTWFSTGLEKRELYHGAAREGRFTLGGLTGTVDPDSRMVRAGEGMIGGYLDASWSDLERVQMSFTVQVIENLVE